MHIAISRRENIPYILPEKCKNIGERADFFHYFSKHLN